VLRSGETRDNVMGEKDPGLIIMGVGNCG